MLTTCRTTQSSSLTQTNDDAKPAWFTGILKPISVCIRHSANVEQAAGVGKQTRLFLAALVANSYNRWMNYLALKGHQPDIRHADATKSVNQNFPNNYLTHVFSMNMQEKIAHNIFACGLDGKDEVVRDPAGVKSLMARSFPVGLAFVESCKDADLEVHFGTSPQFAEYSEYADQSKKKSLHGTTLLKPAVDGRKRRGGVMVIRDHGELLSYSDYFEPLVALVHEWGHIFGVPHIRGTVMDPEHLRSFVSQAKSTRKLTSLARRALLNSGSAIDHWRQLLICNEADGLSIGSGFGLVNSYANPSKQRGLQNYIAFAQGLSNFALEIQVSPKEFGRKVEIEDKVTLAEVFKRAPELGAKPLFHESLKVVQWLKNKYRITTVFNGNKDQTESHTITQKECPGVNMPLFEALYFGTADTKIPTKWVPPMQESSYKVISQFGECLGKDQDLLTERVLKLPAGGEEYLNNIVAAAKKETWQLANAVSKADAELPAGSSWCGPFHGSDKLCIWRSGDIALARIQQGDVYQLVPLTRYLPKYVDPKSDFQEHWRGDTRFETKLTDDPAYNGFHLRIGLQQDMRSKPRESYYEAQVHLAAGLYYPLGKGILKQN